MMMEWQCSLAIFVLRAGRPEYGSQNLGYSSDGAVSCIPLYILTYSPSRTSAPVHRCSLLVARSSYNLWPARRAGNQQHRDHDMGEEHHHQRLVATGLTPPILAATTSLEQILSSYMSSRHAINPFIKKCYDMVTM